MFIYDYSNIENIYVLGGICGDFNYIPSTLNRGYDETKKQVDSLLKLKPQKKYSNSIIICAGDNNIGFNNEDYYRNLFSNMNEFLSKTDTTLIFVRGNNDDPSFYNEKKIDLSHIKTIPDYSVIITKKGGIICIGGGLSLDRTWREKRQKLISNISNGKRRKLYWEDEMPQFKEDELNEILSNEFNIFGVISHVAPTFAFPEIVYDNASNDEKIDADKELERIVMDKVYSSLRSSKKLPCFWCYTHYGLENREHRANILFRSLSDLNMISIYEEFNQTKGKKIVLGNASRYGARDVEDMF